MGERIRRRLDTILAVDVVGYSHLIAADEKGTHVRLYAMRCGRPAWIETPRVSHGAAASLRDIREPLASALGHRRPSSEAAEGVR